ncbi:MAG: ABC transporter ATP-binding protein [Clostridia bacterium]|nr:ABC transporter ATP-binding protein [Clostridia bacterium]
MYPQRKLLIFVVLCGLIGTAMMTVGPLIIGRIIDVIQLQVDRKLAGLTVDLSGVLRILGMLLCIYAVSSVMTFFQWDIMARVTQDVVKSLRKKVNDKLSRMPLKYFDSHPRGEIMSCMINDADNINLHLQNIILQTVTSLVTFVGILVIMLVVSREMTLVTVSILPAGAAIATLIVKRSRGYFRAQWKKTGQINRHMEEMYTGHEVVRSYSYEKKAMEEFDEINEDLFFVSRKAQFISGTVMPFLNFVNNFGYVLICVFGAYFVLNQRITLGIVVSFVTYSKLFTQPIVDMANIMNNIQSSLASAERIFDLLDEGEESFEAEEEPEKNVRGHIEFEHVYFSYSPDKPLISDLNLSVEPGQVVAIVGHTGAGKTTIVNLLMRFYEVDSGKIKIDGKDIRKITRKNLRKLYGMVLQDTWLFNGTIRDNIAYAKTNATDDDVYSAAKRACAHDFIMSLPNGYDTVVGEDSDNISQGQKQLITIARTILSDPTILIFDEATSSVDTKTEKMVQQAMDSLTKDKTSFIIAHRLSTIREADVILVMENGAIVESGSHEELMKKKGAYHTLYMTQYSANR